MPRKLTAKQLQNKLDAGTITDDEFQQLSDMSATVDIQNIAPGQELGTFRRHVPKRLTRVQLEKKSWLEVKEIARQKGRGHSNARRKSDLIDFILGESTSKIVSKKKNRRAVLAGKQKRIDAEFLMWSGKRLAITDYGRAVAEVAHSKIRSSEAPLPTKIKLEWKRFEKFSSSIQSEIRDELSTENSTHILAGAKIAVARIPVSILPAESIEAGLYVEPGRRHSTVQKDWESDQSIVDQIKLSILDRGYNTKKLLWLTEEDGEIDVRGGNHRLQAVRQLQQEGKLPKSFRVPCFITRSKIKI